MCKAHDECNLYLTSVRNEEVRIMETKVRDIAGQREYKRKLGEGYHQAILDCLTEVHIIMILQLVGATLLPFAHTAIF